MNHPAPEVPGTTKNVRLASPSPSGRGAALLLLGVLFLLAFGTWFYASQEAVERRKINDNLDAVSKLKAGQIARWRSERLSDVDYLAHNRDLLAVIERWLKQPQAGDGEAIIGQLRLMQQHANYLDVLVVDAAGQTRLSASARPAAAYAVDHEVMHRALLERRAVLSDLHTAPGSPVIHLDAVAPLLTRAGRTLGAIIVQSDAADFLFPTIQAWPTASGSAETLLVRRDGEHVLFLNPLRHEPASALSLRIPLSQTDLPAARAALGHTGGFEGRDYRGAPVLSVLRPIPDAPWFLVTKLDASEAYADWQARAVLILGLLAALVVGVLAIIFWQRRRVAHYRQLHAAEATLRHGEDLTRAIADSLDHAVAVIDGNGIIVRVNRAWREFAAGNGGDERMCEGVGLDYLDVCAGTIGSGLAVAEALAGIRAVLAGKREVFTLEYLWHSPGRQRWFTMQATPLLGGFKGAVVSHLDISERRASETRMRIDREHQDTLRQLLEIALKDAALEDALAECLDRLLALPWLSIRPGGGIHVVTRGKLEMVVARNLTPVMQRQCAAGPGDHCLCAKAAASAEGVRRAGVFAAGHADQQSGSPRSLAQVRWCLPLLVQGEVVGVLMLQLPGGSPRDRLQEEFLTAATNILAALIQRKRAEDAQRRFAQVLQQSSSVICLANSKGEIEFVNDAYTRVTGYTLDEVKGRNPRLLQSGQTAAATFAALWQNLKAGDSWSGELINRRKNGEIYVTYQIVTPIRQDDGRVSHYASISEDVTARKHDADELARYRHNLEELVVERTAKLSIAETRIRLILESTADGLFGSDVDGRFSFVNPAACRMLGYKAEQLIGRPVHATIHHRRPDGSFFPVTECPQHSLLFSARAVRIDDDIFWRADGQPLPVAIAGQPMFSEGRIVGTVVSFTDIGERKRVEAEREAALTEARRLARAKSDFLANMSHEIRTPLNAVLGFARIGMRENEGRKTGDTCGQIFAAGEHLLGVINDILDFSKIEAGKLSVEAHPFALAGVVDQVISFLGDGAVDKGLQLDFVPADDLPAWVLGDALRLRQILVNLLGNAIKFTRQGQIRLAVTCAGDTLSFSISDTGIGLSQAEIGRLFTAFEQADNSTTRIYGGTGLGLALSRQFARLMGGDIEVLSTPGAGSVFTLHLPLPAASPPERFVTPLASGGQRLLGLHVLAAEDIELNRLVLADLLEQEGASVRFAENGRVAIERLLHEGRQSFDLVLMDIQMPVMDGLEATRCLQEIAPDLPVIGLTAHALAEERERCRDAGMVEHVTKPIDPDELVAAMLRHAPARPQAAGVPWLPALPATLPATLPAACTLVKPPAAAVSPAPAGHTIIDWAALNERFQDRQRFIDKLLHTVRTSQREVPAKLRAAAQRQDGDAIRFIAHTIKGVSGNLMARRLYALAGEVEDSACAGHGDMPVLAERLAATTDELLAALNARLGHDSAMGGR